MKKVTFCDVCNASNAVAIGSCIKCGKDLCKDCCCPLFYKDHIKSIGFGASYSLSKLKIFVPFCRDCQTQFMQMKVKNDQILIDFIELIKRYAVAEKI